jgi:hypothetical protein
MTEQSEDDRRKDVHEARPVHEKAPWKTPRLVVQGTITVRTLGKSGADTPSAAP